MNWTVSGNSSWLSYAPAGGTIASGSNVIVSVTVNSTANTLGLGSYSDTISFANTTSGLGNTTRAATLTVVPPAPVITSALTATGTTGLPFSYQITATNSPSGYASGILPSGLHLDPAAGLISGTATAPGMTSVIICASNAGGIGRANLLITIQASYAGWKCRYFTTAQLLDPTCSGDAATPGGDGIPNLMKYALNLNPWANGIGGMPVSSILAIGGTNYLTLNYTENIYATDVSYIPEVSGDLKTWNSGPGFVSPVSVTPNADGMTETVIVQDLTPVVTAPRFIRLRVIGP